MEKKTEASQACPKNFGHPHDYSLREDGKCAYCQHDEEASQAVDEPVLPHLPRAVGYRHTMDNTEGLKGNKPVVVFGATKPNPFGIPGLDYSASFPVTTETLFTANQMKAYARAALKAQPAPTEAAQGEDSARLDDLATIRELDRLGMELGAKLVRMDTTTMKGREYLYREDVMIAVTDWRNEWGKNSKARKPIDRARASAETGGVKR